ncbi:MAG: hypothetical protein H6706_28195 [Myxococcales bacterium]|nr:hypothetical protein [Myxococcales bacterium]
MYPPPPTATTGNQIELLVGEIAFFRRLAAAFEGAKARIWISISFISADFRLPDGRPLWTLLEGAADRGVEVRLLAWRNPGFFAQRHLFEGRNVPALHPGWAVRWQTSPDAAHCHHEKVWIVDAGRPDVRAFVGGVVMTRTDLPERARAGIAEGRHDLAAEVAGPAADAVAQAFASRWATAGGDAGPPPPAWQPALRPGTARVQVARTLRPGVDRRHPAGSSEILAAWLAGLRAARHTVYLENQHPGEPRLLAELARALDRGVQVVLVVPGEPMGPIEVARRTRSPRYAEVFDRLSGLVAHPGFTLAAVAQGDPLEEVYVHAKLTVVDGAWLSVGSANFVDLSLTADHTELNLVVWDADVAGGLLRALARLHGVESPATLGAEARANAARRRRGEPMVGRLYALDPRRYALGAPGEAIWG